VIFSGLAKKLGTQLGGSNVKRMALVGPTVLIGALVFGLGASAGAADYPPTTGSVTIAPKSVQAQPSAAAQGAALPRTGGDSLRLVWTGGVLLVAGSALVARGRRRAVRS
jgi:LPXTG-motif cell wall-anchored protein